MIKRKNNKKAQEKDQEQHDRFSHADDNDHIITRGIYGGVLAGIGSCGRRIAYVPPLRKSRHPLRPATPRAGARALRCRRRVVAATSRRWRVAAWAPGSVGGAAPRPTARRARARGRDAASQDRLGHGV